MQVNQPGAEGGTRAGAEPETKRAPIKSGDDDRGEQVG